MGKIIDITGQKFNHLYVISHAFNKNGRSYWNCLCDCGKTVVVLGSSLKSGNTKACGCHQKDGWSNGITHGKSKTRQYRIWQNMKNRCLNSKDQYFKNYGGRGIKVCDEWIGKDGFISFYNWAIGNGYKENLTLDRINNDGDYCPENCRWVGRNEQMRNTRRNRILEYKGRKQTMIQWSEELNIPYHILNGRINQYGWSTKDAIETPIQNVTERHNNFLHLGRETAEPEECVAEMQKIVPGANVFVAERGLEVELRKKGECPF